VLLDDDPAPLPAKVRLDPASTEVWNLLAPEVRTALTPASEPRRKRVLGQASRCQQVSPVILMRFTGTSGTCRDAKPGRSMAASSNAITRHSGPGVRERFEWAKGGD
jgi:hypothetical protein